MHVQGNTPPPELPDEEAERGDTILLTDSSVEGEDVAGMLRARGFVVVDVPLSLIESRVAGDNPRIVVVDIDQPGAVERAKRLLELPAGRKAELFLVGDPLRAAEIVEVMNDHVFERPVDVVRLVERVVAVASPAGPGFGARGTTPPPLYLPRQSSPPDGSIPPISEFPRAQDPLEGGSPLEDGVDGGLGQLVGHVRLSPALTQEIVAAEERVRAELEGQLHLPTPSEDSDCLVPPDLLIQLDEPLDALEELDGTGGLAAALGIASASGSAAPGTGAPGTGVPGTGAGRFTPVPGVVAPPPSASEAPPERPATAAPDAPEGTRADGIAAQPPTSGGATRGGSPALGIRLNELLGLRVEEPKRPSELPVARATPIGLAALSAPGSALAPNTTQGVPSAVDSATQRGDDLLEQLVLPPTPLGAAALMTATPMSPPVRFQEPRDFGEGRAFDLRTIPPQNAFASFREPRAAAAAASPQGAAPVPFAAPRAAEPAEPAGISPAAASVRAATARPEAGTQDAATVGIVFGEREGLRPLARAIAARASGSFAITAGEGTRRVLLSDGDVVTAASEIADESLVAFLAGRGDLDRDVAARLAGKLPASGRHAGAALIAQSHLTQDDLWPVLRAHAEWLLGRAMLCGPGSVEFEADPPARLKAEPSVFGGATGAEIFVEAARRVLAADASLAALGGFGARLEWGARKNLLAECALGPDEEALVHAGVGSAKPLAELSPDGAHLPVIRALAELEVIAPIAPVRPAAERKSSGPDPLDEEAVRQKVKAKLALVRDGDYFSLLGVAHDATSYEVKRAYLDLRRGFEPARLLTPKTVDLHDDVSLILEVIEEAFDILREPQRRERYRRAIEAGPPL